MTKIIPLTQGKVALVDDNDYKWLNQWKWYMYAIRGLFYARRGNGGSLMHRLILGAPPGVQVDHRNGDGLDNRRGNLRLASHAENQHNQKLSRINNTSGYKGVTWSKERRKWRAQIGVDGKTHYLGYYNNKLDAARTYNAAAEKLFGPFARLNSIPED
jgi:hypothetical protein